MSTTLNSTLKISGRSANLFFLTLFIKQATMHISRKGVTANCDLPSGEVEWWWNDSNQRPLDWSVAMVTDWPPPIRNVRDEFSGGSHFGNIPWMACSHSVPHFYQETLVDQAVQSHLDDFAPIQTVSYPTGNGVTDLASIKISWQKTFDTPWASAIQSFLHAPGGRYFVWDIERTHCRLKYQIWLGNCSLVENKSSQLNHLVL